LFYNFCHKNLHIFALPSSAVLKPAQAGLVLFVSGFQHFLLSSLRLLQSSKTAEAIFFVSLYNQKFENVLELQKQSLKMTWIKRSGLIRTIFRVT
jgi:hypothetical protein